MLESRFKFGLLTMTVVLVLSVFLASIWVSGVWVSGWRWMAGLGATASTHAQTQQAGDISQREIAEVVDQTFDPSENLGGQLGIKPESDSFLSVLTKKVAGHLVSEPQQASAAEIPVDTALASVNGTLDASSLYQQAAPAVGLIQVVQNGQAVSQGTGFIVSASGYVVTNHHVVDAGHRFDFHTQDGRQIRLGKVLLRDEAADLAVLQLPGGGWPWLGLSQSNQIQVGQRVYALGNPMGLTLTLSEGLISARRVMDGVPCVQTTAPISPGSSGGPLLNAQGQVVGVNSFQLDRGQNLNFAVDVSQVRQLLFQLGQKLPQNASGKQTRSTDGQLVLEAIMAGAHPVVVIGGQVAQVGQTVLRHQVLAVGADYVDLLTPDGENKRLHLKKQSGTHAKQAAWSSGVPDSVGGSETQAGSQSQDQNAATDPRVLKLAQAIHLVRAQLALTEEDSEQAETAVGSARASAQTSAQASTLFVELENRGDQRLYLTSVAVNDDPSRFVGRFIEPGGAISIQTTQMQTPRYLLLSFQGTVLRIRLSAEQAVSF